MHYSFSSVLMAFLTSNILLIVISLFLCSRKIMVNAGYKLLALLLGVSFLRFLFPVEFPFTQNLYLPNWLSEIIKLVIHPFYFLGGHEISCWTFLEIVWLIGFIVKLIGMRSKNAALSVLISIGADLSQQDPYKSVLTQVCHDKKKKNIFKIVTINGLQSPMLYGIFKPCILIPKNLVLSERNLYYTLSHEVSHHYHHDLVLKRIVSLVTAFYWWNPASHILNKQVELIMEMRIDNDLISSGPEDRLGYMNCLIYIREFMIEQQMISEDLSASFLKGGKDEFSKRFEMMFAKDHRKARSITVFTTAIVLCIYILSYVFILEAYLPPEGEMIITPAMGNSYVIDNGDGTYDFYLNDTYVETTNCLEYYFEEIPIYSKEE